MKGIKRQQLSCDIKGDLTAQMGRKSYRYYDRLNSLTTEDVNKNIELSTEKNRLQSRFCETLIRN